MDKLIHKLINDHVDSFEKWIENNYEFTETDTHFNEIVKLCMDFPDFNIWLYDAVTNGY